MSIILRLSFLQATNCEPQVPLMFNRRDTHNFDSGGSEVSLRYNSQLASFLKKEKEKDN
jgi:hypothetical protein